MLGFWKEKEKMMGTRRWTRWKASRPSARRRRALEMGRLVRERKAG
jgi:hypothetical protein